ncbi:MAG: bifunctional 2-keto-4-hydroxyglutarate aldolase/2-keto-3-deoxy-6-phosphogluconate aldolase [Bacillota bacterium]
MYRWNLVNQIADAGLVPVIRATGAEQATMLVKAVAEGGAETVEITMTVPGALESLRAASGTGLLVGAGTVLDAETARLCLLHGAQYLVTPGLCPEVIKVAHRYGKPALVGAQTVSEAIWALEEGADIIKLFPGSHLGPAFLKALRGPLPQAPCMPTGGVSLQTLGAWLDAGAIAVGVGSELTAPAARGDHAGVTALARQYVTAIREARASMR